MLVKRKNINSVKFLGVLCLLILLLLLTLMMLPLKANASGEMLLPTVSKSGIYASEKTAVDISNASEGYVAARYTGESEHAKIQIYKDTDTVYTYTLFPNSGFQYFPLSEGDGRYSIVLYEPASSGGYYNTIQSIWVNASLRNDNLPFLYSSQYIDFASSASTVKLADKLAINCTDDAEIINAIQSYVAVNITYDTNKLAQLKPGYAPNPDLILSSGRGICFDYASVMAAMLRSQGIPTKLEMGTVSGGAYHAWVKVYTPEHDNIKGKVLVKNNWSLLDPTFVSTQGNYDFSSYVGNGTDYSTEYVY